MSPIFGEGSADPFGAPRLRVEVIEQETES